MSCMQQTKTQVDIPALLPSWQRSLRAARRSPRTVQSYTEAAEQLADFLVRHGMPTAVESIRREHVESFIEDLDTRLSQRQGGECSGDFKGSKSASTHKSAPGGGPVPIKKPSK